jgi:hypothetical protein
MREPSFGKIGRSDDTYGTYDWNPFDDIGLAVIKMFFIDPKAHPIAF